VIDIIADALLDEFGEKKETVDLQKSLVEVKVKR
jgi:hypothetical protein